jgi:Domain of unknown function (DUF4440)
MRREKAGAIAIKGFTLLAVLGTAHQAMAQEAPEPHTSAAVIADDQGWLKAEETGDTRYLDALLMPEYRSVNSDGTWQDKAFILRGAAKQAGSPTFAKRVQAWKATHPSLISVVIKGDVAVLTFALDKGADPKRIMSCDVFVYRDGHWRALYSQHSDVEQ